MFLSTCIAQTNNTGGDCVSAYFKDGYNATGSITTPGFRVNDTYPSSSWTWSQYIVDYDNGNNISAIWQTLSLKTDPVQNLSDPKIPYTACSIAPTGIKYAKNAQRDDGTCSSVFSSDCLKAIQDSMKSGAAAISGSSTSSTIEPCSQLLNGLSSKGGKCDGVFDGWISAQFMPSNFSEPRPTSSGCNYANPGDSNATSGGFFSWSDSSGTETAYYDAIRFPQPIFIAAWLKDTSNGSSFTYNTDDTTWSDTRVMCIPGNTTMAGSRNITEAEKAANAAGKAGPCLFAVVGFAVLVGIFF